MAKWSGKIGYIKTEEVERGIWTDEKSIVERTHYGDTIRNHTRIQPSSDSTNSDIVINVNLSIIADTFAIENLRYMKYAVINGVKWRITDVEPQRPRLILQIGGIYNGK